MFAPMQLMDGIPGDYHGNHRHVSSTHSALPYSLPTLSSPQIPHAIPLTILQPRTNPEFQRITPNSERSARELHAELEGDGAGRDHTDWHIKQAYVYVPASHADFFGMPSGIRRNKYAYLPHL